jgi:hypothetical protein
MTRWTQFDRACIENSNLYFGPYTLFLHGLGELSD